MPRFSIDSLPFCPRPDRIDCFRPASPCQSARDAPCASPWLGHAATPHFGIDVRRCDRGPPAMLTSL